MSKPVSSLERVFVSAQKRLKKQSPPQKNVPVFIGEVPRAEGAAPPLNHDQRRKDQRDRARRARRTTRQPLEMTPSVAAVFNEATDSLISEERLASMVAGEYVLESDRLLPPQTAPRLTYAQKLKQRAKANKLKRSQIAANPT